MSASSAYARPDPPPCIQEEEPHSRPLPTFKNQCLSREGHPTTFQGRLVAKESSTSSSLPQTRVVIQNNPGGGTLDNARLLTNEEHDPAVFFVQAQQDNNDVERQEHQGPRSKSSASHTVKESETTFNGGISANTNNNGGVSNRKKYKIAAAVIVATMVVIGAVVGIVVSRNDNSSDAAAAPTGTAVSILPPPETSAPRTSPPPATQEETQPPAPPTPSLIAAPTHAPPPPTSLAPTPPFFQPVGEPIDGTRVNNYLGSALAMSKTGHRIAVASPGAVRVMELVTTVTTAEWQQVGQEIDIASSTMTPEQGLKLQEGGFVTVDMDSNGEHIVTGFGDANNKTGMAQVYRYVTPTDAWIPMGQPLLGTTPGDHFGAAVSMNRDGDVIAVGAPGHGSARGMVGVYQLDSNGAWGLRDGQAIQGDDPTNITVSELGGSVSLSANGQRVAAAARTNPDEAAADAENPAVVKVFQYNKFAKSKWTAMGEGVSAGTTKASTGWFVSLSAAGDRMVVSNSYLYEKDFVNKEKDSLRVQAFGFVNDTWERLGENMHANKTGSKSGYIITFSDDGSKIGMGDPGTSSGGRGRGHAHIYSFQNNEWTQIGPDIEGEADGDRFGFAVALSGDANFFAVGAPFNRAADTDSGRVQVSQL